MQKILFSKIRYTRYTFCPVIVKLKNNKVSQNTFASNDFISTLNILKSKGGPFHNIEKKRNVNIRFALNPKWVAFVSSLVLKKSLL